MTLSTVPITISLEGAAKAVEVVRDFLTPWKRQHAEKMARLDERSKRAEIRLKESEIEGARAASDSARAQAKKLFLESERMRIENRKLELEIQREQLQFAVELFKLLAPDATETDRLLFAMKALPALKALIESPLQLVDSKVSEADTSDSRPDVAGKKKRRKKIDGHTRTPKSKDV